MLQCEKWISDAAQFLLGISKEAPNCKTTEDVDILIKKIEAYRLEGYKEQDGRLNGMERIATDLYGMSVLCSRLMFLCCGEMLITFNSSSISRYAEYLGFNSSIIFFDHKCQLFHNTL
jgi:hypothetical protein